MSHSVHAFQDSERDYLHLAEKAYQDKLYYIAQRQLEKFIQQYSNSPKMDEALLLMGKVLFFQERHDQSLLNLESLIKRYPKSLYREETRYWIGENAFKMGHFERS